MYDDELDDFGMRFDPSHFDEIGEPPPVHILYPHPAINNACSVISRKITHSCSEFLVVILPMVIGFLISSISTPTLWFL
jgi:hypothetical protein